MMYYFIMHRQSKPSTAKTLKFSLLIIVLVLIQQSAMAQCSVCNKALEENLKNDPDAVGSGINTGILYMLVVVYILLMGIMDKGEMAKLPQQ
jgi:hypothetical protein